MAEQRAETGNEPPLRVGVAGLGFGATEFMPALERMPQIKMVAGADLRPQARQAFEARRDGGSPLDRLVRRLLGLDLKMQQYRQGGAFVRAVVEAVGVDGFNRVWTSPETLPTRLESLGDFAEKLGRIATAPRPIDIRYVTEPPWRWPSLRLETP